MIVLVDSGSTHNFLDPNLLKKSQINTNVDIKVQMCR